MSVKIVRLEAENIKRVRAVAMEPAQNGLTVIGGRNGQGKTSVLDAIAWALGGEKFRPDAPKREDSVLQPEIRVTLSNGIVVERKGKNGALKVTDPSGSRSGQQLLNQFVEQLALNLPRFMQASDREKAETLLKIIGVGDQLTSLDRQIAQLYSDRTAVGRIADQKKKFFLEMPFFEGMPDAPVSAAELIRQQQDILAQNGENARKRARRDELEHQSDMLSRQIMDLRNRLSDLETQLAKTAADLTIAQCDAVDLHDESTAELEQNIADIDELNRKIRANLDREKAHEDANLYAAQYETLSQQIEELRNRRAALLNGATLPLPGLGLDAEWRLTYNGFTWDGMSSSEQLRVATAIVRALNPSCGFVLMDKLEQMDPETMRQFGRWLEQEGLQVIATRVSTDGDECSIIIEDGEVAVIDPRSCDTAQAVGQPIWKEGEF